VRVVFVEDVPGVAHGGDIKSVKPGFARNYLLPQKLAIPATADALKRAERLKKQAEATRLKRLEDLKALAQALEGQQVKIEARAGAAGRLYGSVTTMQVAAQLSTMIGREVDKRTVQMADAIRQVGVFPAKVRLHPEVEATVTLLVYPAGTDPMALLAKPEEPKAEAAPEASAEQPAAPAGEEKAAEQ
jgi:large subunit ribosomal protein L9